MNINERIAQDYYKSKVPYPIAEEYPKGRKDEKFREARRMYTEDQSRLHRQVFRADLFEEYGVVGNPKAALCFDIAWDLGHSAGLAEVDMYFDRLVALIKD